MGLFVHINDKRFLGADVTTHDGEQIIAGLRQSRAKLELVQKQAGTDRQQRAGGGGQMGASEFNGEAHAGHSRAV